ncbi:hypothetical protein [Acidisphaera sp. S103]|uniref:hypothetical protein n=1 Tax=Acidisphaera sp. S103 TaxID=1747223 RepID=UPI00131C44A2|nr:hypothetical protein [Acidisphaera sp. S103]
MSNQTWNEQNLSFAYAYPDFDSTYEYQTIAANGTTYEDATGNFSFSVSQVSSNVEQIEISNFTDAYGSYFPAASFNGLVFFGPAGDAPIIGATLVSTNMAGLTQSDIAYSSTSVGVNWENLNDYTNTFITIDVTFGSALPPTLTSVTPAVIEQGQATVIATVTPGGPRGYTQSYPNRWQRHAFIGHGERHTGNRLSGTRTSHVRRSRYGQLYCL